MRPSCVLILFLSVGYLPGIFGADSPVGENALIHPAPPDYADGWMDLLPDPNFAKWTRKPLNPAQNLRETTQWQVNPETRILTCSGDQGHEWLRYDHEFTDFILHVEWRFKAIPPSSTVKPASLNSGIYVRNNADGWIYHQSQVKISSYLFAVTPVNGVVQRLNLPGKPWAEASSVAPKLVEIDPANHIADACDWNTTDLLCQGKAITQWINGKFQSRFNGCEIPRGFIGLEAEGHAIEFRNIRIRELP